MARLSLGLGLLLLVFLIVGNWLTQVAPATESAVTSEALLRQINAMTPPILDQARRSDEKYVDSYVAQMQKYEQTRGDLIKALYIKTPDYPGSLKLMSGRWLLMAQRGQRQQVLDETAPILKSTTDLALRTEILFVRAAATVMLGRAEQSAPAVEEFLQAAPQDERGGELLFVLGQTEHRQNQKLEIYRRVADRYAATRFAQMAQGALRQIEGVGKPFELEFTDTITGKKISVQKDLKGKIVVIDFWATWCGPCVAEMPSLKELYATFKDKGVEFIGVSLDEPEASGGLKKLKDFVQANGITWPQYYQGDAWNAGFSSSWGISSIPATFIVDKEGKLISTEAHGLEQLIPELLTGVRSRVHGEEMHRSLQHGAANEEMTTAQHE